MRKVVFVPVGLALFVLLLLFFVFGKTRSDLLMIHVPVQAAVTDVITPTLTDIQPYSALNDLSALVVITGTNFSAVLSGTVVITTPQMYLGSTALEDITLANSTTLTATVPWGMNPGGYTLTLVNPDGGIGVLTNAFTVEMGIGHWNGGDLFGGEGRQILVKPGDPNTVYAVGYSVGLFRSRDAGEHWSMTTANVIGNADFVLDPYHPSWLYSYAYKGLHLSKDEGDTWEIIFSNWPDGRAINLGQVYVSPNTPQLLFFSSTKEPIEPEPVAQGLIKSTDGGSTWQIIVGMEGIDVKDLDFHPTDPLKIVLGTQDGQVFQSIDGGDHWSAVLKPPVNNIGLITYNPYKPEEVWVSAAGDTGVYKSVDELFTSWQDVTPSGVRNLWVLKFTSANSVYTVRQHSPDGGLTWQLFGPETGYGEIAFNPTNPQIAYIGDMLYGVQKTTDGGQTWEIKNQGFSAMIAESIETSQLDPRRVYATLGSWRGFFRSNDGATSWNFIPIEDALNIRAIREDPFTPQHIYAAADTGFYISLDAGLTWNRTAYIGEGMASAMEPDIHNPGRFLAGFQIETDGLHYDDKGQLYASNDYGQTWQPITVTQDLAWIVDIAFHPETPGLVYLSSAGTGLYQSNDSGNTWNRIDDLAQPDMLKAGTIAIATHPQPLLMVKAGDYLARSNDNGITWEIFESAGIGGVNTYIFLDRDSTQLFSATWFGLYFSSDGGYSWRPAAGDLGKLNVTALNYATLDEQAILYAGTTGGIPGAVVNIAQAQTALSSNIVEAGIYRFVQNTRYLFLPLVLH